MKFDIGDKVRMTSESEPKYRGKIIRIFRELVQYGIQLEDGGLYIVSEKNLEKIGAEYEM